MPYSLAEKTQHGKETIQEQIKEYLEWCETNCRIPNRAENLWEFCKARDY